MHHIPLYVQSLVSVIKPLVASTVLMPSFVYCFFLQCLYPTMINYQLAQFAVQFTSAPKMVGVRKIKHCALNAGRL